MQSGMMVVAFQLMAEKELRGEPLTEEEYERIRYYGGELEHLTMAAADTPDTEDPNAPKFLEEDQQAAVIADVATDPGRDGRTGCFGGSCRPGQSNLCCGTNRVSRWYKLSAGGQGGSVLAIRISSGRLNDRLTDEKWRTMLDEGQAPELADWMDSFYAGIW